MPAGAVTFVGFPLMRFYHRGQGLISAQCSTCDHVHRAGAGHDLLRPASAQGLWNLMAENSTSAASSPPSIHWLERMVRRLARETVSTWISESCPARQQTLIARCGLRRRSPRTSEAEPTSALAALRTWMSARKDHDRPGVVRARTTRSREDQPSARWPGACDTWELADLENGLEVSSQHGPVYLSCQSTVCTVLAPRKQAALQTAGWNLSPGLGEV